MQIGFGDLDVIPENIVEPHLQRLNPGARALAGLDLGDIGATVEAQVAKLVEFGMEAGPDGASIGECQGRVIGEGFQDAVANLGDFIQALAEGRQRIGALQRGDLCQRAAERQQLARPRRAQRHLCQQALDIEDALEQLADFSARDGLAEHLAHRVEAGLDFGAVERGAEQALAQEAAAHAGRGLVEHAKQRGAFAGEDRLDQLEVAHGDGVEHHVGGAVIEGRPVQVVEGGALGFAQVVQNRSGGGDRGGAAREAASIERQQAEVLEQGALGVVEAENPVFEIGAEKSARNRRRFRREQHLAGPKLLQVGGGVPGVYLGHAELAGRDVHVSHRAAGAGAREGGEVVVLVGSQQLRRRRRAGRDDPGDLALHQFFGKAGILHLVADGYAIALLDKAGDVALGGVVRDAAHGDGHTFLFVARGERDFELARCHHGVVEKELVEIPEAEQEQRVGDRLLDRVVLPHQRRGSFGGQGLFRAPTGDACRIRRPNGLTHRAFQ